MPLAAVPSRRRQLSLVAPEVGDLEKMFLVLSDGTRLKTFALLTQGELCVCELIEILGLPQSSVSNHLRVLRRAGLIKARRDDVDCRWVYYSLVPEQVNKLKESCQHLFDLTHMSPSPASCPPEGEDAVG